MRLGGTARGRAASAGFRPAPQPGRAAIRAPQQPAEQPGGVSRSVPGRHRSQSRPPWCRAAADTCTVAHQSIGGGARRRLVSGQGSRACRAGGQPALHGARPALHGAWEGGGARRAGQAQGRASGSRWEPRGGRAVSGRAAAGRESNGAGEVSGGGGGGRRWQQPGVAGRAARLLLPSAGPAVAAAARQRLLGQVLTADHHMAAAPASRALWRLIRGRQGLEGPRSPLGVADCRDARA